MSTNKSPRIRRARLDLRKRALALLGVSSAAMLATAFAGASVAHADDSTSSTSSSGASSLGGFQISSTASGITWNYEQPNAPVPATPTLEANLGFSQSSFDAGPTGESLASTLWPGQVAANGASQFQILLSPYIGSAAGSLPSEPWPIQAASAYPPVPGTPATASQNYPGVTQEANSSENTGTATTSFNTASAVPGSDGFVSVQSVASSVESTVNNGLAVAQSTANVHGVSIAGGLVKIGQITSTATSTSDGNQAKVDGTSTASQVTVGGQNATLDSSGLHVSGNSVPLGSVLPSAQQALQTAGISMTLTNPTDTVNGASGERQLDGVQIKIDVTTLDKQINQLAQLLPQQLQTQVIDQLPLATPDSQIITIDLGWANVQSAASPPYNEGGLSASSPIGSVSAGPSGTTGSGGTGFGTTGTGTGTTGGGGSTGGSSPGGSLSVASASQPAKFFQGLGAGLILLGLLLTFMLAGILWRADQAVGALTAAPPCVGEDPQPV